MDRNHVYSWHGVRYHILGEVQGLYFPMGTSSSGGMRSWKKFLDTTAHATAITGLPRMSCAATDQ